MKLRFETDKSISDGEQIVCAYDERKNDADAGIVTFGPHQEQMHIGHIANLWVPPSYRGKGGAAVALMQYAEAGLMRMGFQVASVLVGALNTHAREFYERVGWQEADVQTHCKYVEYRKPLTRNAYKHA